MNKGDLDKHLSRFISLAHIYHIYLRLMEFEMSLKGNMRYM